MHNYVAARAVNIKQNIPRQRTNIYSKWNKELISRVSRQRPLACGPHTAEFIWQKGGAIFVPLPISVLDTRPWVIKISVAYYGRPQRRDYDQGRVSARRSNSDRWYEIKTVPRNVCTSRTPISPLSTRVRFAPGRFYYYYTKDNKRYAFLTIMTALFGQMPSWD